MTIHELGHTSAVTDCGCAGNKLQAACPPGTQWSANVAPQQMIQQTNTVD